MTQLEIARNNKVSAQMKKVAHAEGMSAKELSKKIAQGKVVIPYSTIHRPELLCGIGEGLSTKVNANIGTSTDTSKLKDELAKLKISIAAGAHAVMDLSTGGNIPHIRKAILKNCPVPLGTVPIYEAAIKAAKKRGSIKKMTKDDLLSTIEEHAKDGVDFFTLHCGITRESILRLKNEDRITDVVSRGGALLVEWMVHHDKENPLLEEFDAILDISRRYDVTISLGDGMRPGSIADATDRTQIQELVMLGELAQKAQAKGIQVMIEGPGHVPLDQIEANVVLQKRICRGAPFYVLGPLVTDVAPGYDHITSAIGGAIAASHGADFLCYVTRSEHLRLPSTDDVREGIIATRIAAHAADIAKGIPGAREWDEKISRARKKRDWKKQISLSLDPITPTKMRKSSQSHLTDACTMCSEYCSLKIMDQVKPKLKG
jgi:phosphomethylpyrimidine synthase